MNKKSYRQGNVEIMRFIASIIIVTFHLKYIGIERGTHPFSESWIWVEFFLILMGYFTIVHFDENKFSSLDEKAGEAIRYTIKKTMMLYPYAFLSLVLQYLIKCPPFIFEYTIEDYIRFFFDATMFTGVFYDQKALNGVLWFFTVTMFVYPAFSLFCQMKSKKLLYIISFYVTVLIYGYQQEFEYTRAPMSIVRVVAGLCMGILVYAIVNKLKSLKLVLWQKALLTLIELGIFGGVLWLDVINKSFYRFSSICFVAGLSIMLSQRSFTGILRGNIADWLGRISMTIYFFHPVIGSFISYYCPDVSLEYKVLFYYVGTIIFSFLMYCVIEEIREIIHRKMLQNICNENVDWVLADIDNK